MVKDVEGQENGFRDHIAEKKAEALIGLKEMISACREVEIISDENGASERYVSVWGDRGRLREFLDRVERYMQDDVMYLDREAAAMVSYLHDYLYELRDFMDVSWPNVPSYIMGTFVCLDLQMWADEAERTVIHDMDTAQTKLETHSGDDWEAVRHRVRDELHMRTALYHLQDPPEEIVSEKDAAWKELIEIFRKY